MRTILGMKITRRGFRKDRGTITIVDKQIELDENSYFSLEWDNTLKRLIIPIPGVPGQTRHEFRIEVSPAELSQVVDFVLCKCSNDKTMKSYAKAMAAFINEAASVPSKGGDD